MNIPLRELDIWKKDSEEGVVCGMFGCTNQHRCPLCGSYCCGEHVKIHFYVKRNFKVLEDK